MKRIIFISLFIFGATFSGFSQDNLDVAETNPISYDHLIQSFRTTVVQGSPYLFDAWFEGKIITNTRAKSKKLTLRFNALKNKLEYKKAKRVYVINPKKINGFIILGSKKDIVFKNGFAHDKFKNTTFLRVVYDGSVKLLAHHITELKEDIPDYGNANKVNKYVNHIDYYLQKDGNIYAIDLEKESILNILSVKRNKLAKYASSNNLSFKTEKEVRKILKYYDKTK